MISERLSSLDPRIQIPAYEAFGNLWRFTGSFPISTRSISH
jgi:hypothetical protein